MRKTGAFRLVVPFKNYKKNSIKGISGAQTFISLLLLMENEYKMLTVKVN